MKNETYLSVVMNGYTPASLCTLFRHQHKHSSQCQKQEWGTRKQSKLFSLRLSAAWKMSTSLQNAFLFKLQSAVQTSSYAAMHVNDSVTHSEPNVNQDLELTSESSGEVHAVLDKGHRVEVRPKRKYIWRENKGGMRSSGRFWWPCIPVVQHHGRQSLWTNSRWDRRCWSLH